MQQVLIKPLLGILLWLAVATAGADTGVSQTLVIAEPFIELHSGPDSVYPVLQVIDRGQRLQVLRRVTHWYRVRGPNGIEGWVNRDQLQRTLNPRGEQLILARTEQEDFIQRHWELGVTTGELEQAPVMSLYLNRALTPNLSLEATLAHAIGSVSSSSLVKANMLVQPFEQWSYSPFISIGFGNMRIQPRVTLVNPVDRDNDFGQVGLGIRKFINRRFVLRLEINQYVLFSATSERDANEEIEEWKLGFAIFF